jgi:hypothetical protein
MDTYETSTTVGGQGEIHVAGVPFRPGTEVEVVISPKTNEAPPASAPGDRLGPLLEALDQGHNVEPVGSLRRDELYDRNVVR